MPRREGLRMDEQRYLIVHKVRGEAAIDVAQRFVIGREDVWLIPTSGHRAWPFHFQPLDQSFADRLSANLLEGEEWQRLRDHYAYLEKRKGLLARLLARVRWSSRRKGWT